MPRGLDRIPKPTDNSLVDDATLEHIWAALRKEFHVSDDLDMQFLTWIEPSGLREVRGIVRIDPEHAWFMVVSPSPNPNGDPVRTFGSTPLKGYYEAIKDYGHYNGRSHPAKTIFGHLVRQHLLSIGALTGLTDVDEATYEKNLKAQRWIAEETQRDRYEEGVTAY